MLPDFCLDEGEKVLILLNYFTAHIVKKKINGQLCFSKQDIKVTVNYILSNCDVMVGKKIFSQITGVPMGSEPAPFFANLFLYCYESR